VKHGLRPEHRLLDIGCGTLRAGRHFIRYLHPGGYTGIDISSKAIEYGKSLVAREGLRLKAPSLLVNDAISLTFEGYGKFDFVLAQSVFTHLYEDRIEECLQNVHKVLTAASVFFFTFNDADAVVRTTRKDFRYPYRMLADMAERAGLSLRRMEDYPHPKGQSMVAARLG
jgi:SAM-dependent methyltransferase